MSTDTDTTTDTIVRPARVLHRADHDPGPEWPELVRELRIDERSQERHSSRVAAAEWALARAFMALDDDDDGNEIQQITLEYHHCRVLRTIAAIELHGCGGPLGISGGATARMPWARLGKGRKHATDGAAWNAAIGGVFGGVTAPAVDDVVEAYGYLDDESMLWAIGFCVYGALASPAAVDAHRWLNAAVRGLYEMAPAAVDALRTSESKWMRGILEQHDALPACGDETVRVFLDRVLPISDPLLAADAPRVVLRTA